MCGTQIVEGKCQCGVWLTEEEIKDCPIINGIEFFHEMKKFTFTGDAPDLGCAVVYFRGNYNDCKKVEKYIYEMNNRKYYDNG